MKINWAKTSVTNFSLKGTTKPWDIIDIFKSINVKQYTYEIRHKNHTIKYGMSCAGTTQLGERLYRQIGHLDSWNDQKITGPNGSDFEDINERYKELHGSEIDHKEISVIIWSFDNYPFRTINVKKEINEAEIELIKTYKIQYGCHPIGNIDDGSMFYSNKPAPIKHVWDSIFESAE